MLLSFKFPFPQLLRIFSKQCNWFSIFFFPTFSSLYLPFSLSIYLSLSISIYLSLSISIYPSLSISIYLSLSISIFLYYLLDRFLLLLVSVENFQESLVDLQLVCKPVFDLVDIADGVVKFQSLLRRRGAGLKIDR